jgi:hypothetical protein
VVAAKIWGGVNHKIAAAEAFEKYLKIKVKLISGTRRKFCSGLCGRRRAEKYLADGKTRRRHFDHSL